MFVLAGCMPRWPTHAPANAVSDKRAILGGGGSGSTEGGGEVDGSVHVLMI